MSPNEIGALTVNRTRTIQVAYNIDLKQPFDFQKPTDMQRGSIDAHYAKNANGSVGTSF
jgi:hypothetical protein